MRSGEWSFTSFLRAAAGAAVVIVMVGDGSGGDGEDHRRVYHLSLMSSFTILHHPSLTSSFSEIILL
jgi:hypothetical protein